MTDRNEKQLLGACVDFIDDHRGDFAGGGESDEYLDGFDMARHLVREFHLMQTAECDCPDGPLPDHVNDGRWVCGDCDTVLGADVDDDRRRYIRKRRVETHTEADD